MPKKIVPQRVLQHLCGKFLYHDYRAESQGTHITEEVCRICGHITYFPCTPKYMFHFADSRDWVDEEASKIRARSAKGVEKATFMIHAFNKLGMSIEDAGRMLRNAIKESKEEEQRKEK